MTQGTSEIRTYLKHDDISLAVRRILDSSLDTGDLQLLNEAIELSRQYRAFKKGDLAFERFVSAADELLAKLDNVQGTSHTRTELVTAKNISKTYSSGNFSLRPIDLQLGTGDIIGIVGENGNGKTTLLRCMAGQLALDTGELIFPQLQQPDHYTIKHHVAFIPQRIPKWHGYLKDNLHFSAALSGITGEQNKVMVNFMLERLDLTAYAHLRWTQISSGYRTRFELARILLQKPSLLILDEPLANLDINAQQSILTDLRFLAKSAHQPMGVLLSSQQLHEVEKVADTVMLIKNGNCLFRTGEQEKTSGAVVVELETKADRSAIINIIGADIQLHFNGSFYTLTSSTLPVQEIIAKLINNNVPVTYFRDISHSTKRFI